MEREAWSMERGAGSVGRGIRKSEKRKLRRAEKLKNLERRRSWSREREAWRGEHGAGGRNR